MAHLGENLVGRGGKFRIAGLGTIAERVADAGASAARFGDAEDGGDAAGVCWARDANASRIVATARQRAAGSKHALASARASFMI